MAKVTLTGILRTTFTDYRNQLRNVWKSAFGKDLSLDPSSPQEQIIGNNALTLAELDNCIVDLAASIDILQATGTQLDALCSLMHIYRKGEIKANVSATITAMNGTVIPKGSKAKTINGDIFVLQSQVVVPSSGNINGYFIAEDSGEIEIKANQLNVIVTPVVGWLAVNNHDDGVDGVPLESDDVYRRRYFLQLAVNSVTPLTSVISHVIAIPEVVDVAGVENDSNANKTIQGVTLTPKSLALSVLGGGDMDIAEAIRKAKTIGCGTNGDTTVSIPVYNPANPTTPIQTMDIRFYRVDLVDLWIFIEISAKPNFPSNGEDQIRNNLVQYFDGTLVLDAGFETDGLRIAEDVLVSRLYTPINKVQGHEVLHLVVTKWAEAWDVDTSYVAGDRCSASNGRTYTCLVDNDGEFPPTAPTSWQLETGDQTLPINLNEKAAVDAESISIKRS